MAEAFLSITNPVRRIQIAAALPLFCVRHSKSEAAQVLVRRIITAVASDTDLRRLRSIMERGRIDIWYDDEPADWKIEFDRENAETEYVARQLIAEHPDVNDACQKLIRDLDEMRNASIPTDLYHLFHAVARVDLDYGMHLARLIWSNPESPLLGRSGVFLAYFRASNPSAAGTILKELAGSQNEKLRRFSAHFLGTSGCLGEPTVAEIEVLDQLLVFDDPVTREAATQGLGSLRSADARGAIGRAIAIDIGSSAEMAQKVCNVLMKDYETIHEATTDADLNQVLKSMLDVPSVEDHHLAHFIQKVAGRIPEAVVDWALTRIKQRPTDLTYHALPFGDQILDGQLLATHPSYECLLRRVRDEMFEEGASPFWLTKLYASMSGNFSQPQSINILIQDIRTQNSEQIQVVSTILRGAGRGFIFKHSNVVGQLLDRAFDLGDDCYKSVQDDLFGSAMHGERSGTAGQPFPQDIFVRDHAIEQLEGCAAGSRLHGFYDLVRKAAVQKINEALLEAEMEE